MCVCVFVCGLFLLKKPIKLRCCGSHVSESRTRRRMHAQRACRSGAQTIHQPCLSSLFTAGAVGGHATQKQPGPCTRTACISISWAQPQLKTSISDLRPPPPPALHTHKNTHTHIYNPPPAPSCFYKMFFIHLRCLISPPAELDQVRCFCPAPVALSGWFASRRRGAAARAGGRRSAAAGGAAGGGGGGGEGGGGGAAAACGSLRWCSPCRESGHTHSVGADLNQVARGGRGGREQGVRESERARDLKAAVWRRFKSPYRG